MLETSLITSTRDHFDRRERRMRTYFILPPQIQSNPVLALFMVKTAARVSAFQSECYGN